MLKTSAKPLIIGFIFSITTLIISWILVNILLTKSISSKSIFPTSESLHSKAFLKASDIPSPSEILYITSCIALKTLPISSNIGKSPMGPNNTSSISLNATP